MPEYGAVKGWKNRVRIGLESAPNESIWHDGRDPLLNSLTMDTSVDTRCCFDDRGCAGGHGYIRA